MIGTISSVVQCALKYWACLTYFLVTGGGILSPWPSSRLRTRQLVHVYSLAATLRLWDHPHYRAPSFGRDVAANVSNVAIPGTGLPLSVFCASRLTLLAFLFVVYPAVALLAAALECVHSRGAAPMAAAFQRGLLEPDHWFALWRLNCVVVALHAEVSRASDQYAAEDKATFLLEGARQGVPVSPFLLMDGIVVKHKQIEGGMGIHIFKNFTHGGDYILQQALHNAEPLAALLPEGAPLSTLRVVTASERWMVAEGRRASQGGPPESRRERQQHVRHRRPAPGGPASAGHISAPASSSPAPAASSGQQGAQLANGSAGSPQGAVGNGSSPGHAGGGGAGGAHGKGAGSNSSKGGHASSHPSTSGISVVTAVWRAGLAGADTDHSAICFPVDCPSGRLAPGSTNKHWYQLGWQHAGRLPGDAGLRYSCHPESGKRVAGEAIPQFEGVAELAVATHAALLPDVPLAGWDVALTPDGACLLEVNLSCNLFCGEYDAGRYYDFVKRFFASLDAAQARPEW